MLMVFTVDRHKSETLVNDANMQIDFFLFLTLCFSERQNVLSEKMKNPCLSKKVT